MILTFKSATTHDGIIIDTDNKSCRFIHGIASHSIYVKSNKELNKLILQLVCGGYKQV